MGGYCYSFKVTGGLCGFLDCWVYDWVYWGVSGVLLVRGWI